MSSDRQCGLGSLLPMSCRGRAEAFARRLHTRLRHLGAEPRAADVPWLAEPLIAEPHPPPVQRLSSDSDVYFDFDVDIDSPSSPAEEVTEGELAALAAIKNQKDPESGCVLSSPVDNDSPPSNSDSDAYYDLEVDSDSAVKINSIKRINDECQVAKNLAKLKFSPPAVEIIDNFVQNRFSPERKSPIKTQPLPRENGYSEYPVKRSDSLNSLYSPIKFDDCQRRNSLEKPKPETDSEEQHQPATSAMPADVVACNGNTSPEVERDEVDFSKHIQVNGHEASLHDNQINICIETNTPENHSNDDDCVIKAINVEVICDRKSHDEYGEEAEEAKEDATLEDAKEVQHRLEKLTLVDIDNEDRIGQNEEDCQDNNSSGDIDAEGDDKPERVRRCSSLRSGKTPPGTPGRKKIVRFADVLGLDLADVKTFMDDIPYIPKSAFQDLRDADLSASSTESFPPIDAPPRSEKTLLCLFQQPGNLTNFLDILNTRSVCLENAVVQEGATLSICGTVRVRNLDFHKSVQIRYTLDGWKTFADLQASYVPNSCDGFCDRFTFLLYAHTLVIGQKLEFAVRFMCKGCQYWDNNLGANYCFQCIPNDGGDPFFPSTASLSRGDSWQGSFY